MRLIRQIKTDLLRAGTGVLAVWLALCTVAEAPKLPDLIPYRKGELWGYTDSMKRVVIEPRYKNADLFSEGMARIIIEGKSYAIIDTSGAIRFKFHVNDTFIADFHNGLAAIYRYRFKRYRAGFVNKEFEVVIPLKYSADDEEFPMGFWYYYSSITAKKKTGIIDLEGGIILKPSRKIQFVSVLNNQFAQVSRDDSIWIFDIPNRKFIINITRDMDLGKELKRLGYEREDIDRLLAVFENHSLPLRRSAYGYIDKYGTEYWED